MLEQKGWSDSTYKALRNFLDSYKRVGACMDYAVFDCDGTLFYGDTAIGLFQDQIRYLNYAFAPDELENVLSMGNPKTIKGIPFHSYIEPLTEAYRYLYERGFVGKNPENYRRFSSWNSDPMYQEFAYKMNEVLVLIYLCWGYGPCAYSAYSLWSGFTLDEYSLMSSLSLKRHSEIGGVQKRQLVDPKTGKAIPIEVGLHPIEEMRNLLAELDDRGIDLYVVSASPRAIVEEALRLFSFPKNIKVLGVENEFDERGRLVPHMDIAEKPYPIKAGKAISIKELISPNYGGRGPILVAGDSEGDVAMMTAFKDTKVSLLLSDEASKETRFIKTLALLQNRKGVQKGDISFLLQGKSPAKACLVGKQVSPVETEVQADLSRLEDGLSFFEFLNELKENDPFKDYASYPGYQGF